MDEGRKKIRLCLAGIVLAAVVIGIFYYYSSIDSTKANSEGTLVRNTQEEYHGC